MPAPTRPSWWSYELVAAALGDALWAVDEAGCVCHIDGSALTAALGRQPGELLGRPLLELLADDDSRQHCLLLLRACRSEGQARGELRLRGRGEVPVQVAVSAAAGRHPDGSFAGIAMHLRDVSGERRAREERDEHEARLRAAFDNFPFDVWVTDRDGRYVFQNQRSLAHWGNRLGKTPRESGLPEAVAAEFDRNNQRAMRGELVHIESHYVHDGQVRHIEKYIAPVRLGGRVRGTLGVNIDVTDRKRLELALAQAGKMEAIGRLAGGIAHDFNNVLTAIQGSAHLLARQIGRDGPGALELEFIREGANRAATLTRHLLAFARQQVLEPAVIGVNDLVLGVDRLLRRLVGADIELVILPGDPAWNVQVDRSQFERVLINLAANARHAMPSGGSLVLRIERLVLARPQPVSTGTLPAGDYICVVVRDTGTGMDAATRARAFEPFFSARTGQSGTGLGLAITYGIVSQAGGQIDLESEPGRGTTVRVFVPRCTEPRPEASGDGEALPPLRGNETVLVVDDQALVMAVAAQTLEEHGYRVLRASDGISALDLARRADDRVDLLLTDVVMPRVSGTTLAAQLRERIPGLKVLYMSGYIDDEGLRLGVSRGGDGFLAKPFTPVQLARMVRQVLDR
jgi:hypothetical protein